MLMRLACSAAAGGLLALLLLCIPGSGFASAASAQTAAPQAQKLEPLAVLTGGGRREFQVEVARNDDDRARGLMFRRSLAPDRGMLFDFARVEPVSMWMQNTYIPLDMLFIRPDGSVARVAENAEPLSTRTIPSGESVLAVLELAGGTAARLGIKAGDRVEHPLFARR
jgi:uncharacterized protein